MQIRPRHRTPAAPRGRITMLLENNPYPRDVRVRAEAEALVRAGYAVEVIAPRDRGEARRETVAGVEVRRFRRIDGGRHGAAGYLAEYLVAAVALHLGALRALVGGSSYLHLHNPPDILFPAAALYRLAGRVVVFDHHDLAPETIEAKLGRGPFVRVAQVCERLTFACANHVLATNSSYADVATTRGGKHPDEVTVVRNGPPAAWLSLPAPTRHGVLDPVRLAYVGTLSSQDGVEGLAPVLAALRSLEPPIEAHLEIIGDGDARASLEGEFARQGVGDLVTFTGWVDLEHVPDLLARADVCVDPAPASDVNQRSTMIKLAEYLALGKPVVAYDLLEARRTVAGAALLVPPGDVAAFTDAVARLARDGELRAGLAAQARTRAADLTWERSEQALVTAYAALRTRR